MRDFLECHAFIEHLRMKHTQIHHAIVAVEHELQAASSPSSMACIRKSLQLLRETLAEHFTEEEQGGCLEEAVSCAPYLSVEVGHIEREHQDLSKQIEQLIERADDGNTVAFRESFQKFAEALHTFNQAESRVLHTAFGTGEFETNDLPTACVVGRRCG